VTYSILCYPCAVYGFYCKARLNIFKGKEGRVNLVE